MKLAHLCIAMTLPVAALALSPAALALQVPRQCGPDEHVRCATYDTNEVYLIPTAAGQATLIQFEPGELVDEPGSAVGVGYAQAWSVGAGGNWILFKPKATDPDTNMLVVTNRRRYSFKLASARQDQAPTWMLSFDYPDTRARQSEEARRKAERVAKAMAAATPGQVTNDRNVAFRMRGDTVLAPTAMWDDGRFTYLQFDTSRDRPDIFRRMPDGSEASVNLHIERDTIVVHDTARDFVLRLGQAVLGIHNDGYSEGSYNAAGTTVRGTVRLTKGDDSE